MSITSATLSEIVAESESRSATETETYIVITDSSESARTLRQLAPGNASGLPVAGEMSEDTLLVAKKIRITRDPESRPSKQVFYYSVEWAPKETLTEGGGGSEDPLEDPPEIEGGGIEFEEVVYTDIGGDAFRNSAGEMYNPQPTRAILGGACTITRNELNNPFAMAVAYSNSVNESDWYGIPAGQGKLGLITFTKQFTNGVEYWRVSYPMQFKRDGWKLVVIDNGFNELVGGSLQRIMTTDEDGNKIPTNIPSYLDGAGTAVSPGGDTVAYPEDGFKMFTETDWNALDLPDPTA